MNLGAILLMVFTVGFISVGTGYFFIKVLRAPSNTKSASYLENEKVEGIEESEGNKIS